MIIEDSKDKKCTDCGRSISFLEFLRDNPSLSRYRAKDMWNDSMISIFCPDCYFHRPEKPFKIRRGYFKYNIRFRR